MDAFDPGHICNHSDDRGRYAYARQRPSPSGTCMRWRRPCCPCCRAKPKPLASACSKRVEAYRERFAGAMLGHLRTKLGLAGEQDGDQALADDFLKLMAASRADFTQSFRRLSRAPPHARTPARPVH